GAAGDGFGECGGAGSRIGGAGDSGKAGSNSAAVGLRSDDRRKFRGAAGGFYRAGSGAGFGAGAGVYGFGVSVREFAGSAGRDVVDSVRGDRGDRDAVVDGYDAEFAVGDRLRDAGRNRGEQRDFAGRSIGAPGGGRDGDERRGGGGGTAAVASDFDDDADDDSGVVAVGVRNWGRGGRTGSVGAGDCGRFDRVDADHAGADS